jgi:argininosuccinate lyase
MKGLPLAYNKDMQEDKEALFDAVDTVKGCLTIFIPMLETMTINRERMLEVTKDGFLNATDLADYLVGKGLPFRTAHTVVGKLVKYCLDNRKRLEELSLEEFHTGSSLIGEDIYEILKIENVVQVRNSSGGTSFDQVKLEIEQAGHWLRRVIST